MRSQSDSSSVPQAMILNKRDLSVFNTSLQSGVHERWLLLLEKGTDADVCLKVGPEEKEMMAHRQASSVIILENVHHC